MKREKKVVRQNEPQVALKKTTTTTTTTNDINIGQRAWPDLIKPGPTVVVTGAASRTIMRSNPIGTRDLPNKGSATSSGPKHDVT